MNENLNEVSKSCGYLGESITGIQSKNSECRSSEMEISRASKNGRKSVNEVKYEK